MQDPKVCAVCDSLWVSFAQATARYAKLILDQQRREPEDARQRETEESEILGAAELRREIRERLEAHERRAHHEPGMSAATDSVRMD